MAHTHECEPDQKYVFLGMEAVIASESMRALMEVVERAARSSAAVLIAGESGSGKELVARAIHHYSTRSHRPWVDLSCAALPEHLLESELFGFDKGAFSGADSPKPGLFELACQGTIFLDEIGELDGRMQVKLLRVLDGAPYYRLGGVKKVAVDVRVVAATNQDLETSIAAGRFRRDLYHRLSQITLRVPPLRERPEDIAPLARHFLAQHGPRLSLSDSALAALKAYWWPGNIRELRNVVTRAAVLSERDEIREEDLPSFSTAGEDRTRVDSAQVVSERPGAVPGPAGAQPAASSLDGMERRMIWDALAATGGHQQKAAARLGISRRTLSRKLRAYELERRGPERAAPPERAGAVR